MFEIIFDFLLVLFIVLFWFNIFRKKKFENSKTPCVSNDQSFSDPYGIIYDCIDSLPTIRKRQIDEPADDEWFNPKKLSLEKYTPLPKNYFRFSKKGLKPLDFDISMLQPPFVVDGNRIVKKDVCFGKKDGDRVSLPPGSTVRVGIPYGVCKDGKLDKIFECPKYNIFDNGECVYKDPCLARRDGYVLETGSNYFTFCDGKVLTTKTCKPDEKLINFKCVQFPCKDKQEGFILDFNETTNSFRRCIGEQVVTHVCKKTELASSVGCKDYRCKNLNGLNAEENSTGFRWRQYAYLCKEGRVKRIEFDKYYDQSLYNFFIANGGNANYFPHLKRRGRIFAHDVWEDVLDLLGENSILEMSVPFKLRREPGLDASTYFNDYCTVKFYVSQDGTIKIEVNNFYYEGIEEPGAISELPPESQIPFEKWFAQSGYSNFVFSAKNNSFRACPQFFDIYSQACVEFNDNYTNLCTPKPLGDIQFFNGQISKEGTSPSIICVAGKMYREQNFFGQFVDVWDVRNAPRFSFKIFKDITYAGEIIGKAVEKIIYVKESREITKKSVLCGERHCHDKFPAIVKSVNCKHAMDRWVFGNANHFFDCLLNKSILCDDVRLDDMSCVNLPIAEYVPLKKYIKPGRRMIINQSIIGDDKSITNIFLRNGAFTYNFDGANLQYFNKSERISAVSYIYKSILERLLAVEDIQ